MRSIKKHRKKQPRWELHLYVANSTPRSLLAKANLDALCAQYLRQGYSVCIIDIVKDPAAAIRANVLAVPTLVRVAPGPPKRVIGSLSDAQGVLRGLDIGQMQEMSRLSPNPATVVQKMGTA